MKKLQAYFRQLTLSDSKESSKRFMALFTMALAAYVVLRFTNTKNCEMILGELLSFILVLMGVAVWQNVRGKKQENTEDQKEKE